MSLRTRLFMVDNERFVAQMVLVHLLNHITETVTSFSGMIFNIELTN